MPSEYIEQRNGGYYVAGTRISLDSVVYSFNDGQSPEAIQEDFQFPLSDADQKGLEYVYKSFRDEGLEISYRMEGGFGGRGNFPTFKEILAGTDLNGKQGNFLATADDFEFIRNLHRKNLIIPVVADFAGKKGLVAVGEFLRKNGYTVTAFYTSNVEQYLFQNEVFAAFAENVRKLPITDKSLFIRSASGRFTHPARLPNHRSATLLEGRTATSHSSASTGMPTRRIRSFLSRRMVCY